VNEQKQDTRRTPANQGVREVTPEPNNDAGLAARPSKRWTMNANWFRIAMLAYNLNCRLLPFQREETATVADMPHVTLATARLRFLFLAACRARRREL
jgi:hypothetical protein